jgi:hypothetical protein
MSNWHQINAQRIRFINYGERVIGSNLKAFRKSLLKRGEELGGVDLALSEISEANIRDIFTDSYIKIYQSTGSSFAMNTMVKLKKSKGAMIRKDESEMYETLYMEHMRQFALTRCAERIGSVTRSYYKDIEELTKQIVLEGSNQGWGAAKIAREIEKRSGAIDKVRAMRIARTEVVSASNEGAWIGADNSGFETVKIWNASPSEASREWHIDMNGVQVDHDKTFTVITNEGVADEMAYPCDPSGSAANVINCRCSCDYTTKEDFIGNLIN